MRRPRVLRVAAVLVALALAVGVDGYAADDKSAEKPDFPPEQLEQMVAPIAL